MSTTNLDIDTYIDSIPEGQSAEDACNPVLAYLVDQSPLTHECTLKQLSRKTGASMASLRAQLKWMIAQSKREATERERETDSKQPEWMKQLVRAPNGSIKGNIANAMLFLANEWAGCVGYDEFANAPVWLSEPKWDETETTRDCAQVGRELEDDDAGRLQAWLGRRGCDVNYDTAFRALDLAARNNAFHPIRDFLDSLSWDGVARVEQLYARYFGTEDNDYTRLVSRIQLVSSVARIYRPGCKVDTMVILEGEQGLKGSADPASSDGMLGKGKSSSFKALYGAKHFTDHISELGSKDAFMELQGIWCAEMAELDTLKKADANQAKKFISSATDKYRPAYGRRVKAYPRQCILVGSINPDGDLGYLKDQTGARRYLPITVTSCDVQGIENDRDQIWAEAVYMFRNGVKWWAVKDEEAILEGEQDKRRQADPWEDIVGKFVARFEHRTVSATYLLEHAIGLTPEKLAGYNMSRMGSVLKRLGWQADRVERSGRTIRFYRRPGSEHFKIETDYVIDPVIYRDDSLSSEELTAMIESSSNDVTDTGAPEAPGNAVTTGDADGEILELVDVWLVPQGDGTMTLAHPDLDDAILRLPVPPQLRLAHRIRGSVKLLGDRVVNTYDLREVTS